MRLLSTESGKIGTTRILCTKARAVAHTPESGVDSAVRSHTHSMKGLNRRWGKPSDCYQSRRTIRHVTRHAKLFLRVVRVVHRLLPTTYNLLQCPAMMSGPFAATKKKKSLRNFLTCRTSWTRTWGCGAKVRLTREMRWRGRRWKSLRGLSNQCVWVVQADGNRKANDPFGEEEKIFGFDGSADRLGGYVRDDEFESAATRDEDVKSYTRSYEKGT